MGAVWPPLTVFWKIFHWASGNSNSTHWRSFWSCDHLDGSVEWLFATSRFCYCWNSSRWGLVKSRIPLLLLFCLCSRIHSVLYLELAYEKTLVHFSYCKGWILAFLVWKGFFHKSDIIIIMFIIMFIINNNASFVESLYTSRLFVSSPLQLKFPLHMLYPFLHCMDIAFLSYSRMLMLFYVFSEFLRISTRFASLAAWPASIHEYTIRSGLRWCFFHQHWSSNWCVLQAISMGRRQRQKVQMFGVAVHRLHSVVLTEARARRKCLSDKIRLDPISLICPALWSRACNFPRRFRYFRLVRVLCHLDHG